MKKRKALFVTLAAMLTLSAFAAFAHGRVYAADAMYSWGYRFVLSISADSINETLTDFPVLVHLCEAAGVNGFDATAVFSEVGNDSDAIAFFASDGNTRLWHEVDYWNASEQQAYVWVKLPIVSSVTDTTFYMCFDSGRDGSGYESGAQVWSNGYVLVLHMNAEGSTVVDSSGCGNNGTIYGAASADGKIGSTLSFDGTDDYCLIADSESIGLTESVSVSCWVYANSLRNTGYVWKNTYSYVLFSEANRVPRFHVWDSSNNGSNAVANSALPLNQWVFIVGTFNLGGDGRARIYINGTLQTNVGASISGIRDTGGDLYIGKRGDGLGTPFDGIIDEVRVSNVSRNETWIATEYLSHTDSLIAYSEWYSGWEGGGGVVWGGWWGYWWVVPMLGGAIIGALRKLKLENVYVQLAAIVVVEDLLLRVMPIMLLEDYMPLYVVFAVSFVADFVVHSVGRWEELPKRVVLSGVYNTGWYLLYYVGSLVNPLLGIAFGVAFHYVVDLVNMWRG